MNDRNMMGYCAPDVPSPREWVCVLELLKFRQTWGYLPKIAALIEHHGLRHIVLRCFEDDSELTLERVAELLGSTNLARNLMLVLADNIELAPSVCRELINDIERSLELKEAK